MAANAVITAQTTAATFTGSILAGAVGNFKAHNMVPGDPPITILGSDGAGANYEQITFVDPGGNSRAAGLSRKSNGELLQGPLDFRIVKGVTANAVEVTQYT